MKPVLIDDNDNGFTRISFDLAPGIEAECISRKPVRNLVSTTLIVTIDLEESEDLNSLSMALGQAIAPVIISQIRQQLTLRLLIQSETKSHLKLVNEGIVIFRSTAGAVLGPAVALSKQNIDLSQAIETAILQLQSLEPVQ